MKRHILFVLVLVTLAVQAPRAQGPQAQWTQPDVASAAQAATFTYRLYVTPAGTATPNAAVILSGVACTGVPPAAVNCTAPLGPAVASTALVTGAKSAITAQDAATTETAQSAPFLPGASVPTTLLIKR